MGVYDLADRLNWIEDVLLVSFKELKNDLS